MSANIQELIIAFSKTAQTAIHTASTDLIRVNTVSSDLAAVDPVVEDDADEIGKGHEFAEESFLTSWDVQKKLQVYNSAEMLAFAAAFGLGHAAGGVYTPIDPLTDTNEIELPWFTFAEGIRPTGSAVLNRAYLGCVIEKFKMDLKSGAGRKNSMLDIDIIGSGKFSDPSGVTYPAKTPVNLLPSASLTCTINGVDYVAAKNFVECSLEWTNNVRKDSGYFPGSGFQTPGDPSTGAVQGRMEYGKRVLAASFIARFVNGSTELTKMTAQTEGTSVWGLSGANSTSATITLDQIRFKASKVENTNGIVTVKVDMSGQVPAGGSPTNLLSIAVVNSLGSMGRA
jgi:hypothetical protein